MNRPLVISLHGSGVHFARRSRVYGMAARFGFRRASQVTACSTNLYDGALALGVSRERAQIIPYGVHVSMFDGHTDDMRAQMGIPAGTPVIGALGRLAHKKGFGKLIAAMPRVLEHLPDARCVIGGEGDLGSALQAQAESLGLRDRVLFPGFVDWRQVPSFMAMCDLVAVPSVVDAGGNVDGLPNVLLEAMASGRAVVASRVAGIPQAVEHGHSGLLVPPGNVEALATAIVGVLEDYSLRSRLGSAARARVASRFSWEAIVERFESVYLQALAEGQR